METPAPGKCPFCAYKFDAATGAFDPTAVAKVGDFTMCIKCGRILRFAEGLTHRALTFEDVMEINADPDLGIKLRRLVIAHRLLIQDRRRRN